MRILRKTICPSSNGKTFRNMRKKEGKRKNPELAKIKTSVAEYIENNIVFLIHQRMKNYTFARTSMQTPSFGVIV